MLDHYWTFIVHDGQLMLSSDLALYERIKLLINIASRSLEGLVYQRVFSDTFTGGHLLKFTRDQGGRVTGFAVSTLSGFARRVRFVKQLP